MKKKLKILISSLLIFTIACSSQNLLNSKFESLQIQNYEQGKTSLSYEIIRELSILSGVDKKFLTTSIYHGKDNEEIVLNDKVFNYNDYEKIRKIKKHKTIVKIKRYRIKNKEYTIAFKIE